MKQHCIGDGDFLVQSNNWPVPELSYKIVLQQLLKLQCVDRINSFEQQNELEGLIVEIAPDVDKTLAHIKVIYELNKNYGWRKFIIVVPSVTTRESVYSAFQVALEHFTKEYAQKIRFFIYDSSKLTEIDRFASDNSINVMIINSQAFNVKGKDARRIYMKLDEFGSQRPMDIIAQTNPILIIDTALSVDQKTKNCFKAFNPLLVLRFSGIY